MGNLRQFQVDTKNISRNIYLTIFTFCRDIDFISTLERYFIFPGGEPILSCTLKNFSSKVLEGNVPLEIIYGASETGISIAYCTKKYHDRECPAGIGGEPYPGVEVKVLYRRECQGDAWVFVYYSIARVWIEL